MGQSDFSDKKIDELNKHQKDGRFHPYTCDRKGVNCTVNDDDGVLIATKEGWICPCGSYKQNWHH